MFFDDAMFDAPLGAKSKVDQERDALLQLMGTLPQMQAPVQPVNMAFRTPDAIAAGVSALAALLGGKKGGQIGGAILDGWMQGKQGKAQRDTQMLQENANFANQQSFMRHQADTNVAKTRLGFAEQDMDLEERERIRQENMAEKARLERQKQLSGAYLKTQTLFKDAKSLPEMLQHAQKLRALEIELGDEVSGVPSDEDIKQIWAQKSGLARDRIFDNWRMYIDSAERGNYGTLTPRAAKSLTPVLEGMRKEMQMYGLDGDILQMPDTEESLEAKYKAQGIANAKAKLKMDLDKGAQWIIESKARIQRAKERLDLQEKGLAISGFNADTARMNHEIRAQIRTTNNKVQTKVDGIQAAINGLKAKQAATTSPMTRRNIQAQIDQKAAERDYWRSQMEDENIPVTRGAGMEPTEVSQKAEQVRQALASGQITKAQAQKLYEYLNSQGPMNR